MRRRAGYKPATPRLRTPTAIRTEKRLQFYEIRRAVDILQIIGSAEDMAEAARLLQDLNHRIMEAL